MTKIKKINLWTARKTSVSLIVWWLLRSEWIASTRHRKIWSSGIRTFICKPVLIRLVTQMTRTWEAREFSFIKTSIWTRLSCKNRTMFSIKPLFILEIIWWTLRIRMIGTCPSRLIYMASKVLASKVIVNPLVGKGCEKARLEVTETNITGSGMFTCVPLGGLSIDCAPAYLLST